MIRPSPLRPAAHAGAPEIDRWTADQLGDLLTASLRPGGRAQLPPTVMSPALAYGRHRGPSRPSSRVAAIAVSLYRRDRRWWIPLTLRPRFLKHHGGQICLPGGRIEPGEKIVEAALREYQEELGVECQVIRFCGELTTQYVYASDNQVHPVVVLSAPPATPWRPDPGEVAEVIEMPLSGLLHPPSRTTLIREKPVVRDGQTIGRLSFRAPAFRTDAARSALSRDGESADQRDVTPLSSRLVWGATAIVLDQLAQLLRLGVSTAG